MVRISCTQYPRSSNTGDTLNNSIESHIENNAYEFKKLLSMAPEGTDMSASTTPKAKATPKKRTKAAADDDGGEKETGSPKKKARTPASKKKSAAKVKEESEMLTHAVVDGQKRHGLRLRQ